MPQTNYLDHHDPSTSPHRFFPTLTIFDPPSDHQPTAGQPAQPSSTISRHHLVLAILFWLFLLGSLAGFTVETLFALITTGQLLCRANILYLPLNALYGIGAMALYLCLNRVRDHLGFIFIAATLGGTFIEYTLSWGQELIFGTVSWDYSNLPLNIDGRACLLFSLCWGLLGVAWARWLQPAVDGLIRLLEWSHVKRTTIALSLLLSYAVIITIIVGICWDHLRHGAEPDSGLLRWVYQRFPEPYMLWVYSSLIIRP